MTPEAILSFLKFGGPIAGLASAVWSTTQKITYEGADGVKRLTLQGRVLIGIIVTSTLISILALGFETVIARQRTIEAANLAIEAANLKATEALKAERKEQQAKDDAAARDQAAAIARLEADSAEQKRFLEQSLLISAKAAEQQRRDAQISLQFAREANLRASDAEQQSANLDRIIYPLRKIHAEVTLSLDFKGAESQPEMIRFWKQVAARNDQCVQSLPKPTEHHKPSCSITETFTPGDLKANSYIQYGTRATLIKLSFVTPSDGLNPPTSNTSAVIRPVDQQTKIGRTYIPVLELKVVSITANLRDRSVRASYHGEYNLVREGVIGRKKISVPDMNQLVPILTIDRRRTRYGKRPPDALETVSISFNDLAAFSASSGEKIANKHTFILDAAAVT